MPCLKWHFVFYSKLWYSAQRKNELHAQCWKAMEHGKLGPNGKRIYLVHVYSRLDNIVFFSLPVLSQTFCRQGKAQVLYSWDWSVCSYWCKWYSCFNRLLGRLMIPHHPSFGPRQLHWQKRHLDRNSINIPFHPSTLVILSFRGRIIGCKGGAQLLHQRIFTPPMHDSIQTYSVSVLLIMCSHMVCLGIYREGIAQQVSSLPFILA